MTYQHFAGPASCVLKYTEKGSEDMYLVAQAKFRASHS